MRARRAVFAAVVLVVVLGVTEAVARVAEPRLAPARTLPLPMPMPKNQAFEDKMAKAQIPPGPGLPMVADESLGWTMPPARTERYNNVVQRYNQLGMRGPDWGPREPNEIRLMTLGDSSIFGLGVMERYVFSSVAAEDLQAAWGCPVTAVIGGIPGYSTSQSRELFARVGKTLQPSWVIVGNMWSDLMVDPGAREEEQDEVLHTLRGFATYRLLRQALTPWLAARKVRFLSGTADVSTGTSRTNLAKYVENLRAMAKDAEAVGARVAYLALPAPMDLDPAPPPERVVTYRAAMRQVASELDAPFVDGPALVEDEHATLGWWMDQVHPSAAGHIAIGHALAKALEARR